MEIQSNLLVKFQEAQARGNYTDEVFQVQVVDNPQLPVELDKLFARLTRKRGTKKSGAPYPVWKEIELGRHASGAEYETALEKGGSQLGTWGRDILRRMPCSGTKETPQLVRVRVRDLGLKDGGTIAQIHDRGKRRGLELCPAEVGPALRLQYADQPLGEWVRLAMESITDSSGYRILFYLEHDEDGLWLDGDYGSPGYFYSADNWFVFVLRQLCKVNPAGDGGIYWLTLRNQPPSIRPISCK